MLIFLKAVSDMVKGGWEVGRGVREPSWEECIRRSWTGRVGEICLGEGVDYRESLVGEKKF